MEFIQGFVPSKTLNANQSNPPRFSPFLPLSQIESLTFHLELNLLGNIIPFPSNYPNHFLFTSMHYTDNSLSFMGLDISVSRS